MLSQLCFFVSIAFGSISIEQGLESRRESRATVRKTGLKMIVHCGAVTLE